MRNSENYDVAVIGAGPVGLYTSLVLQRAGLRVALVGTANHAPDASAFDSRVYALAPDNLASLQALQVDLTPSYAYQNMQVWADQQGTRKLVFAAAEYGWLELGRIVEHRVLQSALSQAVQAQSEAVQAQSEAVQTKSAITWLPSAMLDFLPDTTKSNGAIASNLTRVLTDTHSLRTRWICACDGANSSVRNKLGIGVKRIEDDAHALVATLQVKLKHANLPTTAFQHFVNGRIIALLPLATDYASLVYSANRARITHLQSLPKTQLLSTLQNELGTEIVELLDIEGLRALPLPRLSADRYYAEQGILVGDAAHTVHPLAGLGLNLGLRDAACLAAQMKNGKLDLQGIKRYGRERLSENFITLHALELLRQSFLPSGGPVASLRSLGLALVNQAAPIKRLFAELATGKIAGWR